ncbi:molybdenum cofactor synthesis domain-containing protein [Stackebrandtia albiflava]|uniref:Molybdenum cofactor synthesis domain-containing protein n=2 Tax=Stackebrandtia albiflava TaxID=406432 RepID=A0A562V146_9ACTN|nr:molybdopterin-binding protein [Stackebrandtia albiflava]TWJ11646.1 molybdenum cofactor synthesis domain-containing protein [Stackebrandtia albiflava]
MRAVVIVASHRAAAGIYSDTSGPILADGLRELGFEVSEPVVVDDGEPVGTALAAAIASGADVVVTSGGTGLSPTDRTPEVTAPLLDRPVPGLAEAIRAFGARNTPMSWLSRGLAGVAGRSLVVNLAGSTGAARDGLTVLGPLLSHAVEQVNGGDHVRESP